MSRMCSEVAGYGFRRLVMAVFAVGIMTCRANAQVTKVADAYQLRTKYIAGAKSAYTTRTTIKPLGGATMVGPGANTVLTGPLVVVVQSVTNGSATLKVTIGPLSNKGKGTVEEQAETIQVDAQNKLLDTVKGGTRLDISMPLFPDDPMTIGDRYTTTQKLIRGGKSMDVISTYYFRGVKTVAGQQVAELEASITGQGDVRYVNHGTIYVAVSDGTLVSSDMKQSIRIGNSQHSVYLEAETIITRK